MDANTVVMMLKDKSDRKLEHYLTDKLDEFKAGTVVMAENLFSREIWLGLSKNQRIAIGLKLKALVRNKRIGLRIAPCRDKPEAIHRYIVGTD